jgi:Holliday junction resolvasome RuvABC endonuclease subunit
MALTTNKGSYTRNMLQDKNILCLDMATQKTGWAIFTEGKIQGYGLIQAKNKDVRQRMFDIMTQIENLTDDIDIVIVEDTYMGRNASTYGTLSEMRGMLLYLCMALEVEFATVQPSTWKSYYKMTRLDRAGQKQLTKTFFKEKTGEEPATDDVSDAYCMLYALVAMEK